MSLSAGEIVALFRDVRAARGPELSRMREMAKVVDGDVVIPLPELSANELPAVANLAKQGLQSLSQRAADVLPSWLYVPERLTKGSAARAELRTRAMNSHLEESKVHLLVRQQARYLFGYAATPIRVTVDFEQRRPRFTAPSPLSTFAPQPASALDMCPPWVISATEHSRDALLAKYPVERFPGMAVVSPYGKTAMFELLVYESDSERVVVAAPSESDQMRFGAVDPQGVVVELHRVENRAGVCPWVYPGMIHLNKPQGHFDGTVGMFQAAALLQAMQLHATYKAVFPEMWLVARDANDTPEIIQQADALLGEVGMVRGGDLRDFSPDPGWQVDNQIGRLQEQQRIEGSIPADFGGQAASNVRTGRRASTLIAAAVDPVVKEAQEVLSTAWEEASVIAAATERGYFSGKQLFVTNWRGKQSEVSYDVAGLWGGDRVPKPRVEYAVAGTDTNSLTIMLGQMMGTGMMSRQSAMERHPTIGDVDSEMNRIEGERLEDAFLGQLQAMASNPDAPIQPADLARIIRKVKGGTAPVDAVLELQEEKQAEQAAPVEPGSPEAQPGLSGPLEAPPTIAEAPAGVENFARLASALRRPEMAVTTTGGGRA